MFIYGILSTILFLFALPFYSLIRAINGKFLYGWDKKLGFFDSPNLGSKVIMLHGVSVGEVIALENLIKEIKKTFPDYKIVVTTGTKTGQDIANKKYENIADFITYFPFDIPFCVRKFLNRIQPSVILIAETELWPTFAFHCRRRNIPLYVINGRISDATFNAYKFFKFFFKHVLKNYTEILTQSEEDRDKLIKIGAESDKTSVMKNLKFDIKKSDEIINLEQGKNRVIIAGSTHQGEDEIIIDTFSKLKKQFPDIKLLLAPRHLQRVAHAKELAQETNLSYGFRSNKDTFKNNDIIILDTIGELSKMYSICHFAFIGGSFNKTGGHNPLEAIVYDKPVLSGPNVHNFRDIYHILTKANAAKVVKNQQELQNSMQDLLGNNSIYEQMCQNSIEIFKQHQGALNIVIDKLKNIL